MLGTFFSFLLIFLLVILIDHEDIRNLIHAVEDHSDQFIREDTVSNLLDVKRFFHDLLSTTSKRDLFCLSRLSSKLQGDRAIAFKVFKSFIGFFFFLDIKYVPDSSVQ